jgi:hypothetical protein
VIHRFQPLFRVFFFGLVRIFFSIRSCYLPTFHSSVFALVSHLMPYSPSLLSGASNSTRVVKKAAKSVQKAVKKGAEAISRPFKKRRKLSSESQAEDSCKYFFSSFLPVPSFTYVYITVNDRNSTRTPSTRDSTRAPSIREPSVIEIDDEDDRELASVDETPEDELGKS